MKCMLAGVLAMVCTGAAFASEDVPPALSTGAVRATVEELRRRLAQDGYPTDFLDDPRFMIHPETPRLIRAEQKADFFAPAYGIFTPKAFARAREFMAAHREALDRAHRQYGVWPEYIAALLLVESNYGRNTGTRRVINGLASMYAAGVRGRTGRSPRSSSCGAWSMTISLSCGEATRARSVWHR